MRDEPDHDRPTGTAIESAWIDAATAAAFLDTWLRIAEAAAPNVPPHVRMRIAEWEARWHQLRPPLVLVPAPEPDVAVVGAPSVRLAHPIAAAPAPVHISEPDVVVSEATPTTVPPRRRTSTVQRSMMALCALCALGPVAMIPVGGTVETPGKVLAASTFVHGAQPGEVDAKIVTVGFRPHRVLDVVRDRVAGKSHDEPMGTELLERAVPDLSERMLEQARVESLYVAAHTAGQDASLTGAGVMAAQVAPRQRKASGLRTGDVIVSANDQPVSSVLDLAAIVDARPDAYRLPMTTLAGRTHQVVVRAVPKQLADGGTQLEYRLGAVVLTEQPRVTGAGDVRAASDLPFTSGSCGLSFALSFAQVIEGIDMDEYAATGELQADGTILAVSGIELKARAVQHSGVDVFLVPASQAREARKAAPRVTIVPVANYAEARAWLRSNAR